MTKLSFNYIIQVCFCINLTSTMSVGTKCRRHITKSFYCFSIHTHTRCLYTILSANLLCGNTSQQALHSRNVQKHGNVSFTASNIMQISYAFPLHNPNVLPRSSLFPLNHPNSNPDKPSYPTHWHKKMCLSSISGFKHGSTHAL